MPSSSSIRGPVLVTGGAGFVGSHLLEELARRGAGPLRSTDRPGVPFTAPAGAEVEYIPADLTDAKALALALRGARTVLHTAALYDYSAPYADLYRVNVTGTKVLLRAALEAGVEGVVYWSTASIYGAPAVVPATEDCPANPGNGYERTKWLGEEDARRFFAATGLPVTVLRPAAIYGPRSRYGVASAVFKLARGEMPGIPGNGQARAGHVHVDDVVGAGIFLGERVSELRGQVYNVADDSAPRVEELLLYAAGELGVKLRRVHIPGSVLKMAGSAYGLASRITRERPKLESDTIAYLLADHIFSNAKLKAAGFAFRWPDVFAGMKETIRWYRENGWLEPEALAAVG